MLDDESSMLVRYVYFPFDAATLHERQYERAELSGAVCHYSRANRHEVDRLFSEHATDPDATIVISGTFPRALIGYILRLSRARCKSFFFSDSNIFDTQHKGVVSKSITRALLSCFRGFLCIGTANYFHLMDTLGQRRLARREVIRFPYPHFPDEVAVDAPASRTLQAGSLVRFLYLGRLVAVKNVEAIVVACGQLRDRGYTNFTLEIAGDGPCRDAIERSRIKHGLENFITLTGGVPSSERAAVYARNDVFVLPSIREPWGLVVNESLSAGLAVIAPVWCGAALDLVLDGITGDRLRSVDPVSIADAMERYCRDPNRCTSAKEHGARAVEAGGFTAAAALEALRRACG